MDGAVRLPSTRYKRLTTGHCPECETATIHEPVSEIYRCTNCEQEFRVVKRINRTEPDVYRIPLRKRMTRSPPRGVSCKYCKGRRIRFTGSMAGVDHWFCSKCERVTEISTA